MTRDEFIDEVAQSVANYVAAPLVEIKASVNRLLLATNEEPFVAYERHEGGTMLDEETRRFINLAVEAAVRKELGEKTEFAGATPDAIPWDIRNALGDMEVDEESFATHAKVTALMQKHPAMTYSEAEARVKGTFCPIDGDGPDKAA